MSSLGTEESCYLCGNPARVVNTDYANRRWYTCSADDCGEYEISRRAMRHLEQASELKQRLKAKARACVDTDEILEIIIGADGQPSIKYKPRSEHSD
ncbi:MAG: hypothetical protein AB1651_13620 [Pseudomonadota bacterium]